MRFLNGVFNAVLLTIILAIALAAAKTAAEEMRGYGLIVPLLFVAAIIGGCYTMMPKDEKDETRRYWRSIGRRLGLRRPESEDE